MHMAQTLVLIESPAEQDLTVEPDLVEAQPVEPAHGWTAETLAAALADSLVMHMEARGLI